MSWPDERGVKQFIKCIAHLSEQLTAAQDEIDSLVIGSWSGDAAEVAKEKIAKLKEKIEFLEKDQDYLYAKLAAKDEK